MEKHNESVISARVPTKLKELVEKCVLYDSHINSSDFLRDAVREKISRDYPELYRKLFQEVIGIEQTG